MKSSEKRQVLKVSELVMVMCKIYCEDKLMQRWERLCGKGVEVEEELCRFKEVILELVEKVCATRRIR